MIGYYNYTVILTYIGALFGFTGITYVLNGDIKAALICLMCAGFCDMFDGKIASTMERTVQEKRFGIQIDSLSDLVCFGVLPALIAFACSEGQLLHILVSGIYMLCALIRLAWFNVDEEQRQDREAGSRENYLGLPVTTSAALLPLWVAFACMLELPIKTLTPVVLFWIAVAFISPFRLKKPGLGASILMALCGLAGFVFVLIGVNV